MVRDMAPARQLSRKLDLGRIPAQVLGIARRIEAVGGNAWLVGGSVRDRLLGMDPADTDLVTDLDPTRLLAVFPDAEARDLALGVLQVVGDGGPLAVVSLREEGPYADRRHPDHVRFVTELARDAVRRDFTVNAIYGNLADGSLVDPTGGIDDLARGVLRTVGEPGVRFDEDPLRLLRGLRFSSRLGLAWDDAARQAAVAAAGLLASLSAERVFDELTRAFTSDGRGRALRDFVELGFARVLLPEVAAMDGVTQPAEYHPEGDVLTHVCLVLDHVPPGDPVLAWAAVLHDVGKPPTWVQGPDRIRFDGHDVLSETMAGDILRRLHAPSALRETVMAICREHIRFASLPAMRPRRREQFLRRPDFARQLAFHRADCLGSHGKLDIHDAMAAEWQALPPVRPVFCSGADVLALGVPPGPMVGQLLRELDDAIDAMDAPDRARALAALQDLVVARFKGR